MMKMCLVDSFMTAARFTKRIPMLHPATHCCRKRLTMRIAEETENAHCRVLLWRAMFDGLDALFMQPFALVQSLSKV